MKKKEAFLFTKYMRGINRKLKAGYAGFSSGFTEIFLPILNIDHIKIVDPVTKYVTI